MFGSPRSNNGSSVTSPTRPTTSPAADNSYLQQQQQEQQQQYQQQPMYGMPLSSQPIHTTTAAASSTAAAATAASAASTAAAAVPGSSSQPGQQSNFVPTGPYQYQGAYQPANLQQHVNAAVLSLNQMFPTPMSTDGSSYQRGQMPQGSDGSNNSFSFGPAGQGQQTQQGSQVPSLYQLQSADGTGNYIPASPNPTKIKTTMPFNGQDFYTWSFEFELLVQTAGFWQLYDGTAPFPSHGSPLQQATFRSASLTAYTVLVRNLTPTEQLGIRSFRTSAAPAKAAWLYLQGVHMAKDTVNQSKNLTQLSNIQMTNGEKVTQYINRARNLRDQLQKCGGYFPDAMFHTVLLAGLGPEWRQCRSILRMQAQLSEGAPCAALIAEQQDMDLHNARGGKKMVNNTRTTADSDNILSLGPWEHRDDIDYTDDTVPREGVVPTSSTTAAAVMLTFGDQGLNDVENSQDYMAAVAGWGDTTNMPTDDGIWGADEPDDTTWGETPAERAARLLAESEQRVADMEILDSGRLVGVDPVPAASDQESGELVLAPGEYVDIEPVNRPAPRTICPVANLPHEPVSTARNMLSRSLKLLLDMSELYRPPTAPPGKFDQRAKWGLHLGIEKQYSAWRIMDYRSRLIVLARDCIFYENLTLPVFEQHLASQQNPVTLFHGVRSFANAEVEIAASEEPDSDGAREAAPDPPVPVTSSGVPEFIPLADTTPEDVRE
ncbi:unnamed protein product, partial [Closterium sp. NIES-54]